MSAPAATPTVATTRWQIDPTHTHVEFAVRHLMIATVKGRFADVSGTLELDEQDPSRSSVSVSIGAASLDTRVDQRDAHLRSADFFDVERFPTIRFVSTRVERTPDGAIALAGDLTIRDVTRPVTLAVTDEGRGTDPWGGERAGFSATTRIDRRDFGLTYNAALETGGVLVGDEVKISLEIEFLREPAQP
jgi:polyisoprenoid-binding protein YceI